MARRTASVRCAWCSRPLRNRRARGGICDGCRDHEGIDVVHPAPEPGTYRVVPPDLEVGFCGTGDAALAAGIAGGAR